MGTPWANNRFATEEKAQDGWWPAAASTEHRNFCVLGSEITSNFVSLLNYSAPQFPLPYIGNDKRAKFKK